MRDASSTLHSNKYWKRKPLTIPILFYSKYPDFSPSRATTRLLSKYYLPHIGTFTLSASCKIIVTFVVLLLIELTELFHYALINKI